MGYPRKENYGSKNLAEFASHVRKHVDDVTADPVHLRGTKTAASQLPQSAADGDIWFVSSNGRFYVRVKGAWKTVCALREADIIDSLPSDPVALAAFAATLEEGAHLTVINK